MPEPGNQYVQSLARGLQVITAFDEEHVAMTLSEVAARTGQSRATARRFLLTLTGLGYARTNGKHFQLTPQVLRLGTAYLSGLGLPQIAQPHLEDLSADVGESASVAVLDGTDIVYVARVATRRIMTVGITIGTRFPAHATSMGHVLLAGLAQDALDGYFAVAELRALTANTKHDESSLRAELAAVAAAGYAIVDQELEVGLRSAAVPIRNARREVVGAVNISTIAGANHGGHPVEKHLDRLIRAAAAISEDLSRIAS